MCASGRPQVTRATDDSEPLIHVPFIRLGIGARLTGCLLRLPDRIAPIGHQTLKSLHHSTCVE